MNNEPKHVYFVRPVGMDGPIKIGCSVNPAERLKVLAAWSPFPLELIGSVPGEFKDEGRLHRRFSDLHTRKEWFMSSPLLRHTIECILGGTSIKDACKSLPPKNPIRGQTRPLINDDRRLFKQYGRAIKNVVFYLYRDTAAHYPPADICEIMHRWRRDRMHDHDPIVPSKEEFARLDEFIADPKPYCVATPWSARKAKQPHDQRHQDQHASADQRSSSELVHLPERLSCGGVKESPASIPDYNGVKSPALVTAHGLSGKSCPLSRSEVGPQDFSFQSAILPADTATAPVEQTPFPSGAVAFSSNEVGSM